MKVAAIQHDIVWEDAAATRAHLEPLIAAAAGAGSRLVVLTEMFATGFSMNTARTAEPVDGPTTQFLHEQAGRHDIWIGGSLAELVEGADRPFNQFVLAGPDGSAHRYAKIHPFTYSGEHEHFAAGTEFVTIDVDGIRVTPFICYDLRFADEFWATAPDTDLYVVPANWPEPRREHWRTLLRARAIENQAYVLGCNRVGTGGKLDYVGDSAIVDPMGEVRASAARDETVLVADVDADFVRATRERLPFLPDRR